MKIPKEEITYMNALKGIAIIAVVLGHAESPFKKIIYLFQISLFFFIAGYFYKDIYTKNPLLLIKKRLKSLYLPFLKWTLFFIVIHNFLFYLNIYDNKVIYTKSYFIDISKWLLKFNSPELMLGGFWFLKTLFLVSVVFVISNYIIFSFFKCNYKKIQPIVIVLIFIIGNVLVNYDLKSENLVRVSFAIIIYYFGYLYKKYEYKIKFKFIYAIVSCFVLYRLSFIGSVDMVHNHFVNPIFYIISSLIGIYLSIYLAKLVADNNVIKYIGKNTLIVLALHFTCFKIVDFCYIKYTNLPISELSKFPIVSQKLWVAYSLVGILIPISIKYIYDNINKLIFIKNKQVS